MKLPFLKRRNSVAGLGKKRRIRYLLLGTLTLLSLIYILFTIPPTQFLTLVGIKVSIVPVLFLVMGISIFSLVTFAFGNAKHGILASLFCIIFFWLRLNKLFHPLFIILLVALFLTLELLFSAKKE